VGAGVAIRVGIPVGEGVGSPVGSGASANLGKLFSCFCSTVSFIL